jgi:hypothetical protein
MQGSSLPTREKRKTPLAKIPLKKTSGKTRSTQCKGTQRDSAHLSPLKVTKIITRNDYENATPPRKRKRQKIQDDIITPPTPQSTIPQQQEHLDNHIPYVSDSKKTLPSQEPKVKNNEPKVKNNEPKVKNNEPKVKNNEPLYIPENLRIFLSHPGKPQPCLGGQTRGDTAQPLSPEKQEEQDSEYLLRRATAPLPSNDVLNSITNSGESDALNTQTVGKGRFYWKLALEMHNVRLPFRTGRASRPWHEIKDELETKCQLKELKQQKRNLVSSTFIAYLADEWMAVCHTTRRQVYSPYCEDLSPLDGHHMIQEEERIVIVRLPFYMASRLYTEVACLKFDASLTEEERIEQLLNFNATSGAGNASGATVSADQHPPLHYRCHNCGRGGHWRKDCRSVGRRLEPKGIPKMFLQEIAERVDKDQNVLVNSDGKFVVYKTKGHVVPL